MSNPEIGQPLRQSGLGIASFVLALVVVVVMFLLLAVAGYMSVSGASTRASNALVGIVMFFCWLLDIVAIGLGVAGLFNRQRSKALSITGLVIALTVGLLSVALILFGLSRLHGAVPPARLLHAVMRPSVSSPEMG